MNHFLFLNVGKVWSGKSVPHSHNGDILSCEKRQKLRLNKAKGSWSSRRESWSGRGGAGWGEEKGMGRCRLVVAEQSRVEGAAGSAINSILITGLCQVV